MSTLRKAAGTVVFFGILAALIYFRQWWWVGAFVVVSVGMAAAAVRIANKDWPG